MYVCMDVCMEYVYSCMYVYVCTVYVCAHVCIFAFASVNMSMEDTGLQYPLMTLSYYYLQQGLSVKQSWSLG